MGRKRIEPADYIGKKYGRLTIVEYVGRIKNYQIVMRCKCDCGTMSKDVILSNLKSGITTSCGCVHKERVKDALTKHGYAKSRLYNVWALMKDRCYNERNKYYKDYGGRGIKVCEEWRCSFESFQEWAHNNGYKEGLSIDRVDVNGCYEPDNCRWATAKEQARNKRNNIMLKIGGRVAPLSEWAEILNLPYHTIHMRLRNGWDVVPALTTPVNAYRKRSGSAS